MTNEANLALEPCAAGRHVLFVVCTSDVAVEPAAPANDCGRGADATPLGGGWWGGLAAPSLPLPPPPPLNVCGSLATPDAARRFSPPPWP